MEIISNTKTTASKNFSKNHFIESNWNSCPRTVSYIYNERPSISKISVTSPWKTICLLQHNLLTYKILSFEFCLAEGICDIQNLSLQFSGRVTYALEEWNILRLVWGRCDLRVLHWKGIFGLCMQSSIYVWGCLE